MSALPPQYYQPSPPVPPKQGTNGYAIAALIFALFGCNVFGLVFGIVALVQIPRRRQKGKGLAIAGIVISSLWIVGILGGMAYALATRSDAATPSPAATDGRVSVTQLKAGDCVNDVTQTDAVASMPTVACTQPHQGEVYAVFALAAGTWPGSDAVYQQAEDGCQQRFSAYAKGGSSLKLDLYYLHPTQLSWGTGDRDVTCIAVDQAGTRTGSIKG